MNDFMKDSELSSIAEKVNSGQRLSKADALLCMQTRDLTGLGYLANQVRMRQVGDAAYFYVNLNINPTNICVNHCPICAFRRSPQAPDAYTLDVETFRNKIQSILPYGINEVHIVGGLHPEATLAYYEDLCRTVKELNPSICVHAYTAVEIDHISHKENLPVETVLTRLKAAGLDNMPGGGAELFAPRIRELIARGKIDAKTWLSIHEKAHKLGIKTNATMLYGHVETPEERVDHLLQIRDLQDQTGGFSCFVPLAFYPQNTYIKNPKLSGGMDDLRVIATARLVLDNVPHIKAIWTYLGWKLAQTALFFGADDLHGTNLNEKIVHDAGSREAAMMDRDVLVQMIRDAGRRPVLTNSGYSPAVEVN